MKNTCAIVAIAKNESRYIREWVLYHVAIGANRIVVYDNDSTDDTADVVNELSKRYPVQLVPWPSVVRKSSQRSAYANSLSLVKDCEWALFIDIDEFVVPWGYDDFGAFVKAIPESATVVGINWRIFGSSGLIDDNYGSVLKSFVRCSREGWSNNRHIKSMARIAAIQEVKIHEINVNFGDKVNTIFEPLVIEGEGRTKVPVYGGVQINHYQTKTRNEFIARMEKGNANFFPGHPNFSRDGTLERFNSLDRNEETDLRIAKFFPLLERLSSDGADS